MPKKSKRKRQSGKGPLPKKPGQGKKLKSAKKPKAKSEEKHKIDPEKHPFIHPEIIKISKDFISAYTEEERNEIPGPLHPFLQTLDLSTLVEALKRNPILYFAPIVSDQISYLMGLRNDQDLWNQFGWGIQVDASIPGGWGPPEEVDEVIRYLRLLLEAHANSIFRYDRIEWKPLKKPGPIGGLKNPHPTSDPWTQFIDAQTIYSDYKYLKELIDKSIQIPSVVKPNKQRIERLNLQAMKVLEESQIHWSGLHQLIPDGPAFDPKKPEPTDPKKRHAMLFFWLMRSKDQWEPLDLENDIINMCSGKDTCSGRIEKTKRDGKPAYLAYSILGGLLDVPPEKIKDVIVNYHRKQPPSKKPKS